MQGQVDLHEFKASLVYKAVDLCQPELSRKGEKVAEEDVRDEKNTLASELVFWFCFPFLASNAFTIIDLPALSFIIDQHVSSNQCSVRKMVS